MKIKTILSVILLYSFPPAVLEAKDLTFCVYSSDRATLLFKKFKPIISKLKRRKSSSVKLHLLDTANHSYKILKKTRNSEEDIFVEMARVTDEWFDELDLG